MPDITMSEKPRDRALVEAADKLVNGFAWSAVRADCDEAAVYLQSLINAVRAALPTTQEDGE